jgi:hypothetical protein
MTAAHVRVWHDSDSPSVDDLVGNPGISGPNTTRTTKVLAPI